MFRLLCLCWLLTWSLSAHADERPNIILLFSDDMGWSDIGCYGSEIQTPHLDALAENGLRFSQFYNFARCCPSRACLMSGLYPHQAGMGHMEGDYGLDAYRGGINRRCVTLAEVLGANGYSTYMTGKWHLTRFRDKAGPKDNWPRQRGFQRFYGTITGAGSFFDPTTLCRENTYITPENDEAYQPQQFYYTDAITDNAIEFLKAHQQENPQQPYFLYVAYTTAHWPMHALQRDIDKYQGQYASGFEQTREKRMQRLRELGILDQDSLESPIFGDWDRVENKDWEARLMEVYAAMIDNMDQNIGKLIAEVKRQKDFDNTLFLYLQDNGGCAEGMGRQPAKKELVDLKPLGRDGLQTKIWPPMQTRDGRPVRVGPQTMAGAEDTYIGYGKGWANVSNTPFREYKHWVHEGGISSPLIAHWPKGITARGWNHEVAHLIDIMPTLVDVAGASYPDRFHDTEIPAMEGVSLRPAFNAKSLQRKGPIFWEHEGNRAVRFASADGDWKLVGKHKKPWELYNMSRDRVESNNLAAKEPERVAAMAELWQAWADRVGCVEFGSWKK